MDNKKKLSIFVVTFSGLMLALSILAKTFTQYIPIAGLNLFRLDFYGPFEKLPGMFFGPIIGGIMGALVDVVGFIMTNKSGMPYYLPLTLTAAFNSAGVAFFWKWLGRFKQSSLKAVFVVVSDILFLFGLVNEMFCNIAPESTYGALLLSLADRTKLVTIYAMVIGLSGVVIYVIHHMISRYAKSTFLNDRYFKIFLAILIPGLFFTAINTEILILSIASLKGRNFYLFLTPRLIGQVIETFYEAYIIGILMYIGKPLLKNRLGRDL